MRGCTGIRRYTQTKRRWRIEKKREDEEDTESRGGRGRNVTARSRIDLLTKLKPFLQTLRAFWPSSSRLAWHVCMLHLARQLRGLVHSCQMPEELASGVQSKIRRVQKSRRASDRHRAPKNKQTRYRHQRRCHQCHQIAICCRVSSLESRDSRVCTV